MQLHSPVPKNEITPTEHLAPGAGPAADDWGNSQLLNTRLVRLHNDTGESGQRWNALWIICRWSAQLRTGICNLLMEKTAAPTAEYHVIAPVLTAATLNHQILQVILYLQYYLDIIKGGDWESNPWTLWFFSLYFFYQAFGAFSLKHYIMQSCRCHRRCWAWWGCRGSLGLGTKWAQSTSASKWFHSPLHCYKCQRMGPKGRCSPQG